MRVAIYFTPPADHPLTRAAAAWLGRDAFTGRRRKRRQLRPLAAEAVEAFTAEPRRYGFHATIKAPFRLAEGRPLEALDAALAAFCAARSGVPVGPLRVAALGPFIALVPEGQTPELETLAGEAVQALDCFRAPLSAAELARRMASPLTPAQEQHLRDWGYPHVFDAFRFHMSLTGPLPEACREPVIGVLQERFNSVLDGALELDSLAIFVEPDAGADFTVLSRHRFGRRTEPT